MTIFILKCLYLANIFALKDSSNLLKLHCKSLFYN